MEKTRKHHTMRNEVLTRARQDLQSYASVFPLSRSFIHFTTVLSLSCTLKKALQKLSYSLNCQHISACRYFGLRSGSLWSPKLWASGQRNIPDDEQVLLKDFKATAPPVETEGFLSS